MALILIHLRRILLLLTVVYLCADITDSAFYGVKYSKINSNLVGKNLHVQLWLYIYTIYLYILVINWFGFVFTWNQLNFLSLI